MTIEKIHEVLDKFYAVAVSIDEIKDPIAWSLRRTLGVVTEKPVNKPLYEQHRETIETWQSENPTGRKIDCFRETGISRPTIDKYWKSEEQTEND